MAMTDDRRPGGAALADAGPPADTLTAHLRFTVLRGGVEVLRDGEAVAIGGPQQRRLLAALLAAQGAAVSADRLAESIWPEGEAPDGARRSVMTYVSRLRAAIGGDHVVTGANGYQLVLREASYDADDFEARLAVARASAGAAAVAAYDHALALWSGRAFGDDATEWWLLPVATRLEELRLVAHEERCERLIEAGRHAEAVADLQGLIAEQPLREQFIALEMRALYLGGRQAEALRAYRSFADYLADETGLDPSSLLVDLEHRILIGDPSLAPSSAMAVPGYELGDLIGEGAFGAVYRAVQPSLDREVAVKAIRAELADDPQFVQRFETEAQLVARLEHPHVVPLYDFWRQPGAAFLVFRLLRGGSLADRMRHGPLDLVDVSKVVGEIGGALAAAHALGIVHRDVKPANVLFDESGNSYLVDFGIADGGGPAVDDALRSAGSPLYASPEQARDGVAGPASDQYSLAVVAWEALAGTAPFAGSTATEVVRDKLARTLPPLAAGSDDFAALDAVLQKASAPVPVDRYRDINEFVHAWAIACAGADTVRTTGSLTADPTAIRAAGTLASLSLGSVNPYKGLRAFREADAADFQGRSGLVAALVERVDRDPFVLVVGPSGSGKSSLVHAGAVPALRARDALVVSMVPGTDPFVELEAALRRVATTEVGDIGARLRDPGGLAEIAAAITAGDHPLVVVVDQLEELWTLVPSAAVRDRFIDCIAATLASGPDIRVVATLRADLYDRPLQHRVFGPIVRDTTFAVTPMTANELHDAITVPAERAGVRFEPGLVTAMVGDVVSRPGALPLLQFALTELFERRINGVVTAEAYAELGGIGGAIARRAEQLYDDTPAPDRRDVRLLFTQLVTPGDDNDDLRRRATREELTGIDPGVVDRYLAHRLLVTDVHPVTREPVVEVAHEALLREWPRLTEWIDEDRDTIRLRRALHGTAHDWAAHGRDEALLYRGSRLAAAREAADRGPLTPTERDFLRASHELDEHERTEAAERVAHQARQNRRLRRLLTTTAVLLVVALVAGLLAFDQRNRADDQTSVARAAGDEARALFLASQSATLLAGDDHDLAMLLAVESRRFADRAGPDSPADMKAHDALLRALGDDPLLVEDIPYEAGAVDHVAYTPDGRTFATVSAGGVVQLWDAKTGELRRAQPDPLAGEFDSRNLTMSSTLLANDGPTFLWDLEAQAPFGWQPPKPLDPAFQAYPSQASAGTVTTLALSERGLLARSFSSYPAGRTSSLEIWDTRARALVAGPITVDGLVTALGFSADGTRLAAGAVSPDRSTFDVETLDAATGTSRWRSVAHPGQTTGFDYFQQAFTSWVRFSGDGSQVRAVLSRSTVGAIATLDAATGALGPPSSVGRDRTVYAVSGDLGRLVLGPGEGDPGGPFGGEGSVDVVDAGTGEVLASSAEPTPPVGGSPIRPGTTQYLVQRSPGVLSIRDWTSVGPRAFATVTPEERFGATVVVQPDGRVVDLAEPLAALPVERVGVARAWASSPSGQIAITTDSAIEIWDPDARSFVRRLDKPTDCTPVWYNDVAFAGTARDGTVVVRCGFTGRHLGWDLASPDRALRWARQLLPLGYPMPLELSADGSRVTTAEFGGTKVLDATTGEIVRSFPGAAVLAQASPDGRVGLGLLWDGAVVLTSGQSLQTLHPRTPANDPGVPDGLPALAMSPDHRYVAAWHWRTGVEVWNAETGESVAVIDGRRDYRPGEPGTRESRTDACGGLGQCVYDVHWPQVDLRFNADGTELRLKVLQELERADGSRFHRSLGTEWSLRDDDMVDAACRIVGRDLTKQEWSLYVGERVPYRATCSSA